MSASSWRPLHAGSVAALLAFGCAGSPPRSSGDQPLAAGPVEASDSACATTQDCVAVLPCWCGVCPGWAPEFLNRRAVERKRAQCDQAHAAQPPPACSPCPPPEEPVAYYQASCDHGTCHAERCDTHCRSGP